MLDYIRVLNYDTIRQVFCRGVPILSLRFLKILWRPDIAEHSLACRELLDLAKEPPMHFEQHELHGNLMKGFLNGILVECNFG